MTNITLISEDHLRTFSDINKNLDSDLITSNILLAQDYYIQAITGTKLYEKLLTDIDNDSLTADYVLLLEKYIQDYLLYATYYETLESIMVRPRNNGLLTPQGGDNSAAVDLEMYHTKRQSVKNKMTYYAERLTNYLIEESPKYPELDTNDKLFEQQPDYNVKYGNPFTFNSRRKEEIEEMGMRTYDSRRKQYPQ